MPPNTITPKQQKALAKKIEEKVEEQKKKKFVRKTKPKPVNKGGRPKKSTGKKRGRSGRKCTITPEVLAKLRQAFQVGATDKEACAYAGVSGDALYRYCKKHPEFADEKEELKLLPVIAARHTIVQAVRDGNWKAASYYLTKKVPDEFGDKSKVELDGQIEHKGVIVLPQTQKPKIIDAEIKNIE